MIRVRGAIAVLFCGLDLVSAAGRALSGYIFPTCRVGERPPAVPLPPPPPPGVAAEAEAEAAVAALIMSPDLFSFRSAATTVTLTLTLTLAKTLTLASQKPTERCEQSIKSTLFVKNSAAVCTHVLHIFTIKYALCWPSVHLLSNHA